MSLFGDLSEDGHDARAPLAPLAERMRPRTLDEYLGQDELIGAGRSLRAAIERGVAGSLVLFGPPGVGKTTLALLIAKHADLPDDFGLYVDEWGMWVDPATEDDHKLYQQNTIRDAVVAALNLNIFQSHADVVKMANIAQMVNVLQAMILTDGPRMVLTPTYHVFEMYEPFMGAEALRVTLDTPDYALGEVAVPAISASAARRTDGKIVLALVNADARDSHTIDASAFGARRAEGRILTAVTMDAHNTFDHPDTVKPMPYAAKGSRGTLVLSLPPRSVIVVTLEQ